jgi:hypothetical protein
MPNLEANEAWKYFVSDALASFSEMIEAVEVGTTVNRAKWAGYTLDGFISAWETAYPLVRASGLPLIGPNVTDFEPQYNAGILGMLKRRQCLPDIHSNNMFAERAIPARSNRSKDTRRVAQTFPRLRSHQKAPSLSLRLLVAMVYLGIGRPVPFGLYRVFSAFLVSSEEQMA